MKRAKLLINLSQSGVILTIFLLLSASISLGIFVKAWPDHLIHSVGLFTIGPLGIVGGSLGIWIFSRGTNSSRNKALIIPYFAAISAVILIDLVYLPSCGCLLAKIIYNAPVCPPRKPIYTVWICGGARGDFDYDNDYFTTASNESVVSKISLQPRMPRSAKPSEGQKQYCLPLLETAAVSISMTLVAVHSLVYITSVIVAAHFKFRKKNRSVDKSSDGISGNAEQMMEFVSSPEMSYDMNPQGGA